MLNLGVCTHLTESHLMSDRTGSSKRKAETGTVPHNTQSQGGTLSSSRVLKLYFLPRHYEDILFS